MSDGYKDMSTYEVLDLVYSASSSSTELIAVFISLLSAYFVAAYYFGNKLRGVELLLLSVVYSVFSLITVAGIYAQVRGMMELITLIGGPDNTVYLNAYVSVMLISWILSLLFMVSRWRLRGE